MSTTVCPRPSSPRSTSAFNAIGHPERQRRIAAWGLQQAIFDQPGRQPPAGRSPELHPPAAANRPATANHAAATRHDHAIMRRLFMSSCPLERAAGDLVVDHAPAFLRGPAQITMTRRRWVRIGGLRVRAVPVVPGGTIGRAEDHQDDPAQYGDKAEQPPPAGPAGVMQPCGPPRPVTAGTSPAHRPGRESNC